LQAQEQGKEKLVVLDLRKMEANGDNESERNLA
jgi:hypothetical protein